MPRLLIALLPVAAGTFFLDMAWRNSVGLDRRQQEMSALSEPAEARLDGSWWHLDLDPALIGSSGTNWPAMTTARLCTRFTFDGPNGPQTGSGCRNYGSLYGPWLLVELTDPDGGLALPWLDPAGGAMMELRLSERAHSWLAEHQPVTWPWLPQTDEARAMEESAGGSELEALWIAVDHPLEHMLRDWTRPRPAVIEIAFDPADSTRALPVELIEEASAQPPDLRQLAYGLGFFGAMMYVTGWAMVLPRRGASRLLALVLGLVSGSAATPSTARTAGPASRCSESS